MRSLWTQVNFDILSKTSVTPDGDLSNEHNMDILTRTPSIALTLFVFLSQQDLHYLY